jgi:hypothetical protein
MRLSNKGSAPVIPALFSIVVGVLLLALLTHWAFGRSSSAPVAGSSPADASQGLRLELCPTDFIERVLDPRDLAFVRKESPSETVRLFEQERRALAISWLRYTRRQVRQLMSCHAGAVRQNINLRPALEIELGLHYVRFLVVCQLILGLSYVRGPFQIRPIMGYVVRVTTQLRGVSDKLLGAAQFSTRASASPPRR